MRIELAAVTKGQRDIVLPATTVTFATGNATLARAETEQRPTVLGLIASGRMRPDSGTVAIDGSADYSRMRTRVALIDAPEVCEPASNVTVAGVTAEELMFAGRRSHPLAVMRMLRQLGLADHARQPIGTMRPTERVRLLCELALLRSGVDGLVIVSPDRHGGDPLQWWEIARELAARGLAVLVIAGDASASAIAAGALVERMQEAGTAASGTAESAVATPAAAVSGPLAMFDEDPSRDDTDLDEADDLLESDRSASSGTEMHDSDDLPESDPSAVAGTEMDESDA
ncbi:P-loop NTPase family protein [Rathayibacter soli]|uniref:hypothetical protein n=1 Tax=Rathayibacter soli TaxID=3144168 RepID=UPI0027E4891D|nr:hypothetical protein [Glaciibacter superstes]